MRAQINGIRCDDLNADDALDLSHGGRILVQIDIGPQGNEGGDTFSFEACTPHALERDISHPDYCWARGLLIVERIDWSHIKQAARKLVSSLEADDWHKLAMKLNCYFEWEFEDYKN